MTNEEAISNLTMCQELMLFDPMTGETHELWQENKDNQDLYNACGVAITALREQAEREKGCEYCKEEESRNASGRTFYKEFPHDAPFLTTLDDAHLQVAFDNQSGWVLHFEDDSGDRMFDVKIASCPMCGKRLEVQHE